MSLWWVPGRVCVRARACVGGWVGHVRACVRVCVCVCVCMCVTRWLCLLSRHYCCSCDLCCLHDSGMSPDGSGQRPPSWSWSDR